MTPWIKPYHVEKLESGLLVASAGPTHGVSPLAACYGEWWKMQEIQRLLAEHAKKYQPATDEDVQAFLDAPDEPTVGCDMAGGSGSASVASIFSAPWATCNSTPLENLQKVKEKYLSGLPSTLYGIPVVYDKSVSWPVTCPIQPRIGLATEYPELRYEFERKLADTPAGRWAAEVGEP